MNEPGKKAKLREAQQRHQSRLFGDQAQKPSSQAADSHAKRRGDDLTRAAKSKQQGLSEEEARQLEALRQRNARARARQAPSAAPPQDVPEPRRVEEPEPDRPAPRQHPQPRSQSQPQPAPGTDSLRQSAERSDLAAAALANMEQHVRGQGRQGGQTRPTEPSRPRQAPTPRPDGQQPRPSQPPPQPRQAPSQPPSSGESGQPREPARPTAQQPPDGSQRSGARRPPSPEELDKLLRQMADRARQRRGSAGAPPPRPSMSGMPGRPEAAAEAAPMEAEPPPPDLVEKEKHTAEQSAEILKELQAREASAREDIAPIPQSDQQRAKEEPIEARVPKIRTKANSIDSGPLHEAIVQLQVAMRAQDPRGQVGGVNQVQQQMPHHPLYDPDAVQREQRKLEGDA